MENKSIGSSAGKELESGMKEIYRNQSPVKVGHYKSVLTKAGIETMTRNDNLSGNEISILEFYPALCVINDEDEARAIKILGDYIEKEKEAVEGEDINCPDCDEK